jgi:hypothetical protein
VTRVEVRIAGLAVFTSACAPQLDVGLALAESSTTSAESTSGSTAGSRGEIDPDTTGSGSTGSLETSSTLALDGSSVTGESSGETDSLEDSPCISEQKVCAQVELDGEPAGSCGQTLDLQGITQPLGAGRWSIQDCGSCEVCDGPLFEVEFLAPAGWAPSELPLCSRIAIDFAPLDTSPFACAFSGVAVFENSGSSEDPAPVYIAASITTDPPAAVLGLQVAAENIEPSACDESGCCEMPPGKYQITFSGAGLGMPLTLVEHEEAMEVGVFGRSYDVRDERSHAHEQCGRIPHFDWIMQR